MRPRGDRAGTEVIGRIDWPHIMEGNWPALVSFARVRQGRGRGGEFEIGGRHEDLRRRHAALLRRHLQRSHIRPPIGHIGAPPKLNPKEDPVRSSIGLAGQFAAVEPAMTGRENLEMVARLFGEDRARARGNSSRVVEQIGLVEDADRLVRTYSGGMRRKLDLGANLVGTLACCCWMSPPRGSTLGAASTCGMRCEGWSSRGRTFCSPPSTSTKLTIWPTRSSSSTTAGPSHRHSGGVEEAGRPQGDRGPRWCSGGHPRGGECAPRDRGRRRAGRRVHQTGQRGGGGKAPALLLERLR
jgi:hypothetical protein